MGGLARPLSRFGCSVVGTVGQLLSDLQPVLSQAKLIDSTVPSIAAETITASIHLVKIPVDVLNCVICGISAIAKYAPKMCSIIASLVRGVICTVQILLSGLYFILQDLVRRICFDEIQ